MCVGLCVHEEQSARGTVRILSGTQWQKERRRNGKRERGRPASETLDLHEKKHVAILLLTSAAPQKVGVCRFVTLSAPNIPYVRSIFLSVIIIQCMERLDYDEH